MGKYLKLNRSYKSAFKEEKSRSKIFASDSSDEDDIDGLSEVDGKSEHNEGYKGKNKADEFFYIQKSKKECSLSDTSSSERNVSYDEYKTADQTYDTKHNSTEIEDEIKKRMIFDEEMKWLDEKYKAYNAENSKLETSINQIKSEYNPIKGRCLPKEKLETVYDINDERSDESSDEESVILEKIRQLKVKETSE